MLAVLEKCEVVSGCNTDNTERYVLLVVFKLGVDAVAFYLCCQKMYAYFLSMCSLSIVLADVVLAFFLAAAWFCGAERSPAPLCFLLANASAIYGALPLPVMFLGLLDYCSEDTYFCNQRTFCKYLRSTILILLLWIQAVIYSLTSVSAEPIELDYTKEKKALVCEVEESTLITFFISAVFTAVICAVLPFWSNIPQWLNEAYRLSKVWEEQKSQRNDLFISTTCTETKFSGEDCVEEAIWPRPPLWFSLTLGFGVFWMPYLAMSLICLILGFLVPSYITVNVLWLECINSLLMGVVLWVKSNIQGPYKHLPENVCSWHVFWHLSKGTGHQQLPIAVINPSKGKKTTLFQV
uniref:probable G-protein coupled receptor 160 n=1 Tax=Scatophagus argus TaxID=75038 RepID=UPI001ED7D294|nr:probable G-protein coupled receptor 160 [Scatophagus argus]